MEIRCSQLTGARCWTTPGYLRGPLNCTLDLRWHRLGWGMRWEPYVNVVNVLDRRNVFVYFFDTGAVPATRTVLYQLPILVTFGVDFSW